MFSFPFSLSLPMSNLRISGREHLYLLYLAQFNIASTADIHLYVFFIEFYPTSLCWMSHVPTMFWSSGLLRPLCVLLALSITTSSLQGPYPSSPSLSFLVALEAFGWASHNSFGQTTASPKSQWLTTIKVYCHSHCTLAVAFAWCLLLIGIKEEGAASMETNVLSK